MNDLVLIVYTFVSTIMASIVEMTGGAETVDIGVKEATDIIDVGIPSVMDSVVFLLHVFFCVGSISFVVLPVCKCMG